VTDWLLIAVSQAALSAYSHKGRLSKLLPLGVEGVDTAT
jgi:hypothetical protein